MPDAAAVVREALGQDALLAAGEDRGMPVLDVAAPRALQVLQVLREDPDLGFDFLTDLAGVDYQGIGADTPERFAVVYQLYSFASAERLRLRAWVAERDPVCPSATLLWPAAGWLEREVWDLYGLRFEGHPDLRRILMPDDYPGHPLRKDYPITGRGERARFPVYRGELDGG